MEVKNIHTGETISVDAKKAERFIASGNFVEVKPEPVKEAIKPVEDKPTGKNKQK